MRDEHNRHSITTELFQSLITLLLKSRVTDRQDFVDDQDLRFNVGGNRKSQARVHPGRIPFHRRIDELTDPREVDDRVHLAGDLIAPHPKDRALQVQILPARQVVVKPGRHLDQGSRPPTRPAAALSRLEYSGQQLEHGGLAAAIRADDGQRLTSMHFERDVLQGPEFVCPEVVPVATPARLRHPTRNHIAQRGVSFATPKFLPDMVEDDRGLTHRIAKAWVTGRDAGPNERIDSSTRINATAISTAGAASGSLAREIE